MPLPLLICTFIMTLLLHSLLNLRDSWPVFLLLWFLVFYLTLLIQYHLFSYTGDEDDTLPPDVESTPPAPSPMDMERPTMKTSPTFVRVRETSKAAPTKAGISSKAQAYTNDAKTRLRYKVGKKYRYDMLRRSKRMSVRIEHLLDEVDFQMRFRPQQYQRYLAVEPSPDACQQQQCFALVRYKCPQRYKWDFSAAICAADSVKDRLPVMRCLAVSSWVMRFQEIRQELQKDKLDVVVLPSMLAKSNTTKKHYAVKDCGLMEEMLADWVNLWTSHMSAAPALQSEPAAAEISDSATGSDASNSMALVRYLPVSNSPTAKERSNTSGTWSKTRAPWMFKTDSQEQAREFYLGLSEVDKRFYEFFVQQYISAERAYQHFKRIWEVWEPEYPWGNAVLGRKYPTWNECVEKWATASDFFTELYDVKTMWQVYEDFRNAEAQYKFYDAGLRQKVVPEIKGLTKWDRQIEERRVQRQAMATRVTMIIEVDDEGNPNFTEMKPTVERPDPTPGVVASLLETPAYLPLELISGWHLVGDTLDPALIQAAYAWGVRPPRCTPANTVRRLRHMFENPNEEEKSVLQDMSFEDILRYCEAIPMSWKSDSDDEEDMGVEEEEEEVDYRPSDPMDEDYLHGIRRTREPVEGDTERSYTEPRRRRRLNSQLPDRPIGKTDRVGYAARDAEYSILDWGYHSLAEMFSWIFAAGANWDWNHPMDDRPAFVYIDVEMKDILYILAPPPSAPRKRKADGVELDQREKKRSKPSSLLGKRKAGDIEIDERDNKRVKISPQVDSSTVPPAVPLPASQPASPAALHSRKRKAGDVEIDERSSKRIKTICQADSPPVPPLASLPLSEPVSEPAFPAVSPTAAPPASPSKKRKGNFPEPVKDDGSYQHRHKLIKI